MNTTTTSREITRPVTRGVRARRTGALAVAGALVSLALAPTIAHADHPTSGGGGTSTHYSDIDDVVAVRKERMAQDYVERAAGRSSSTSRTVFVFRVGYGASTVCDIPESLDSWTRRLIALQVCARLHGVPARFRAPATYPGPAAGSVGHCGHEALHQPLAATGWPVSAWYTPTSC
jgi:hypothetical protein